MTTADGTRSSQQLLSALAAAVAAEPVLDPVGQRRLLRPVIADLVAQPVGAGLLAEVTEVMRLATSALPLTDAEPSVLVLSQREWLELAAASDRCVAHTHALQLALVAELDRACLSARPTASLRRDTRRLAADELAPLLKVAPGSASHLVGLARRLSAMPLAEEALAAGQMTLAQVKVLDAVLRALPAGLHAAVEALAVRKAATATRTRLAAAVEQAAVEADPAYAARRAAQGVAERDVRLTSSPLAGCVRLVADLERLDGAACWQVLNAVARAAGDVDDDAGGDSAGGVAEARTLAQRRADALVSVVVGQFSPTAAQRAAARAAAPETTPATASDDAHDGPLDGRTPGGDQDADLPEDTRAPVHIPTPAERAHLAEVHVVVSADDLDDPDDPDDPDTSGGDAADRPAAATEDGPPHRRTSRAASGGPRARRSGAPGFGWVPGIGHIAPVTLREVLARARWRRLVADPTSGVLLSRSRWCLPPPRAGTTGQAGTTSPDSRLVRIRALPQEAPPGAEVSYRPSTALAAFVRARDATCLGPACHHAARSGGIQLDHTRAFGAPLPGRARGGVTEPGNLGCLCQRVHTSKTHGGWVLAQPAAGRFVWTSDLGRTHHRAATPLLPHLGADAAGPGDA